MAAEAAACSGYVIHRSLLPRARIIHDRIGDAADQIPTDVHPVDLSDMRLDIWAWARAVRRPEPLDGLAVFFGARARLAGQAAWPAGHARRETRY